MVRFRQIIATLFAPFISWRKRDWMLLLLCMFISATVWLFNRLNRDNYTTTISFPIHIVHDQENVIAYHPPPDFVPVSITGTGWDLMEYTFGLGMTPIEFSVAPPTKITHIPTQPILLQISDQLSSVRVNAIEEDTLFFDFDKIVEKQVFLMVDSTRIEFKKDYQRVSDISLLPSLATFRGASTLIDKLPDTLAVVVPDDNIDENYEQEVELEYIRDPLLKVSPDEVIVAFEVDLMLKKQSVLQIELQNFSSKAYVLETDATLNFLTRERDKNLAFPDTFKIVLDYKKRNRKDSTIVPLPLELPEHYLAPQILPDTFKIHYYQQ